MNTVHFYVDGGCVDGNPSKAGVYFSVAQDWPESKQWSVLVRKQVNPHYSTNNEAEQLAVQEALRIVLTRADTPERVIIHSDSLLTIMHITGEWKCREPSLWPFVVESRELLRQCRERGIEVMLLHCDRKENVKRLGH